MNFFDHKDLGNHLLQVCPKVVKHSVYVTYLIFRSSVLYRQGVLCVLYDSDNKKLNEISTTINEQIVN